MSGLTPGVSYTFVARARNAVGTGPPSASSNAIVVLAARYTVLFSSADLAAINQAADYFGIPRSEALLAGARVMRFLDVLSQPAGLGSLSAPPPSSGPGSLTAEYVDPSEVANMQELAQRTGVTVEQLHDIGADVLVFFWYISTH